MADNLIEELVNIDRHQAEEHLRPTAPPRTIRLIDPTTGRLQGRPPCSGRQNLVIPDHDSVVELTYQISALSMELRNVCDTLSAVDNSIQETSDFWNR